MTSAATSGEQRAQRKQDLLLASRALRREAVTAFDQLAGRADAVARRVAQARALLHHPAGLFLSGLLGLLVARYVARRRPRAWLRWAWLGWRAWQAAAPALRTTTARR
ncbi:hypothetical protein [uncultured Piscinibacter sp.]|uniref:hypothetical protein n=1 Tax=uncultured Piscinibacter sp. TaxID=1131835 RepID=UPI00263892D4|nr:hypothetical protein [uncultured Piscinibacter sp.]